MADAAEFSFDSKKWESALSKIRKKWNDVETGREWAGILSAIVFKDVMTHFKDEKGPDGAWQSWSKTYQDHMNKIGRGSNKKLQFDGRLRQSFTPNSWRRQSDGILFYNNAMTKSGYAYAAGHDRGGSKKGRPPKRQFMWLSSDAIKDIIVQTMRWLVDK